MSFQSLPNLVQRHSRVVIATLAAVVIAATTMLAQFGTFQPSDNGELWGTRHELTLDNGGAPTGVAFANGNLFVADSANQTIVVYDNAGQLVSVPGAEWDATELLSPIAGFVPNQLAAATVNVDGSDRAAILVSDQASNRVAAFETNGNYLFTLRLTRPSVLPTVTLSIHQMALAPGAKFTFTTGLTPTLSVNGTFVAGWEEQLMLGDVNSGALVYPASSNFVPLLGEFHVTAADILTGTESDPVAPEPIKVFGVAFDQLGNLYMLDAFTERLNVYGPAMNHLFTFGTPVPDLTTAEFHEPYGLVFWPDAVGTGGRLLIGDTYKNRIVVYRAVDGLDADLIVDDLQLETIIKNFTLDLDNLGGFSIAVDPAQNLIATADHASTVLMLSTFRLTAFNLHVLNEDDEVVDNVCTAANYKVRFSLTVPAGFADVENVAPTLSVNGAPAGASPVPLDVYPSTTLSAGDVVTYTYSLTAPGTLSADLDFLAGATASNTTDIAGRGLTVPLSDCEGDTDPSTIVSVPMRPAQVSGWTPVFEGETFTMSLQAQDDDGITSIAYMLEGANESGEEPIETEFVDEPTSANVDLEMPGMGRSTLRYRVRDANGIWSTWRTRDIRLHLVVNRQTNENSNEEFRVGDPEGIGFTYSVNRVPEGFTFSTETGQFAGIASYNARDPYSSDPEVSSGVYNVVVTEHGPLGETSDVSFTWTIVHVNRPPTITSVINGFNVNLNEPFSLQIDGYDPDGDPSIWTVNGKGVNNLQDLPNTISIDGNGLISGTFPTGSDTQYTMSVGLSECAEAGAPPCDGLVLPGVHLATLYEINVGVTNLNQRADVVNPGPQANAENDSPTLQIVASDPENDTLRYEVSGLPAGLTINENTGLISGTVGWETAGTYAVTVEVFDNVNELPRAVTFEWVITNTNRPPVVTPPDRQSNEGETVSVPLAGYASDPDGDAVTFVSATGLPAGLTMNSGGVVTGTLDYNSAGIYPVQVVVTDGTLQGTGNFTWTILNVNRHPVLTVADQVSAEGDVISLQINGSDPDGTAVTFTMNGLPAGFSIDPQTGIITGTFSLTSAGTYTVTVAVSDGELAVSKSFIWTVTEGNQAPVITAIPDRTDTENDAISLQVVASDPDGTTSLTYSATGLPPGLTIDSSTGLISGTLTYESAGVYAIVITVVDGSGVGGTSTTAFTWTVNPLNRPPVVALPDRVNNEGETVTVSLAGYASDPDGDDITIVSASGFPTGLTMNAGALVTGTLADNTSGVYEVTFVVTDGTLQATTTFLWTINDVNRLPILNVADQINFEGDTVSLQIEGSDPDGDELVFTMNGLPAGFTIDRSTGVITGTFDSNSAGEYIVNIGLVDVGPNATGGVTKSFKWTVKEPNQHPIITAIPDRTDTENDTVSVQVIATDPDGNTPLTYSATGLPQGATINPATGAISGTLSYESAGVYTVTITVSDSYNPAGVSSVTFTWTVNPLNRPPDAVDDSATVNQGQSVAIDVRNLDTDPDGDTLTVSSITQPANGTAVLNTDGTVTYSAPSNFAGTTTFTYTISDGNGGTDTATVTVTVNDVNFPPTVTHPNRTNAENDTVAYATTASDPDGDTLTFSAVNLPPGISINPANGTLTGTLGYNTAGTYTPTITVSDGAQTASHTFTWIVTDSNRPPTAVNDSATATQGQSATIAVLVNDFDVDGDTINIVSFTAPSNGAVAKVGNTFVYTPLATFSGVDTFTYTISDGIAGASTATVTITVIPCVDPATLAGGLARRVQPLNGRTEGHLQILTASDVTFNSGAVVTGDLRIVGTPQLTINGSPNFGGTIAGSGAATPNTHRLILNGGSTLGQLVTATDAIALPVVAAPPAPAGTRYFSMNSASDDPSPFATLRSLTLNSNVGLVAVPPGTYDSFTANTNTGFVLGVSGATTPSVYNFQSLTLNSGSQLQIVGPVILTVRNSLSLNGDMGNASHPEWLTLRVSNGDVTLNSDRRLYGYVEAPNGNLTVNSGSILTGGFAVDQYTSNANGRVVLQPLAAAGCHVNTAPVVSNPGNLTNYEGETISRQFEATDVDGDALTFTAAGLPPGLTMAASGLVTGTLPYDAAGVYTVSLTVSDGKKTTTVTFVWTIINVNRPPVVTHPDRTNVENDTVSYTSTASDPDGDTLTFSATGLPPGISINASNGTLTGTLGYNTAGTYTPTITVNDGTSTASHTFNWVVTNTNRPPDAVNDVASVSQGMAVTVTVLNLDSDIDGDTLTVTSVTQPASGQGTVVLNANGTVTYSAPLTFAGTTAFTYTISDGKGGTDTATVTVTVVPVSNCNLTGYTTYSQGGWGGNGAPGQLMTSKFWQVYPAGYVIIGGIRTLKFTSAGAVSAFLPQGGTPAMLTASAINPTSSAAGNFAAQVLALRLAVDYSAAGVLKAGLGDLVMVSGPFANQTVNQVLATANAVLGGSSSALPSGMTVSQLNSIVESLNLNFHEGTVNTGLLGCPAGPTVPTCVAGTMVTTGNSSTYGTAGNVRTFTQGDVSVKVSAFARAKSNGAWTTSYLGAFSPGLGVTDGSEGNGADDSHKVDNVGDRVNYVLYEFSKPVKVTKAYLDYIGSDADMTVWVGTKSDPFNSHQSLNDTFLASLEMTEGIDSSSSSTRWVEFNGNDVSGNILVIAARPNSTNDSFKLGKLQFEACTGGSQPAPNTAPTVTAADRSNYKKTAVSVQITGDDADEDTLTYSATGLPAGTSMNSAGLITGTPTTTGTYTVTVTVTDPSNATGSDTFVWTIQNHAPTITTSNVTAYVGQSGASQAYGTDLDNDALTYSVTGLPPGISMSSSGLFSGTLTTAGVYTVTITVKDTDNATGSSTFVVTVVQPNRAPVAVNDSATTRKNKSVTINVLANDSDPDGDVLTVSLGSVTNGSLTLNSNKTIKFTPKSNYKGAASFTYTISDGKGGTASATVNVNVTN